MDLNLTMPLECLFFPLSLPLSSPSVSLTNRITDARATERHSINFIFSAFSHRTIFKLHNWSHIYCVCLCGREWRAICNRTDSVSDDVYGWSVFFIHSLERVYKKSAHELHGEKETVNTCTSSGHSSGHLIGQWVCLWWYLSLHVLVSSFSGTKKQPLTVSPFFFFVPLIVSLSLCVCCSLSCSCQCHEFDRSVTPTLIHVAKVFLFSLTDSRCLVCLSHSFFRSDFSASGEAWITQLYAISCALFTLFHPSCASHRLLSSLSLRNYTFDKWTHANELTPPRAVCFIHSPDGSWVN